MQCGYFDDENKEYVITTPKTPVKWINYIGTLGFGGFVDHTGGALICCGDPALNRITKYIPQLPCSDFKGETLYLRLKQENKYIIYSPFFVPTLIPLDNYECRVGLGYNRFIGDFSGIRTDVTVFVPLNAKCEIRDIRVTNCGNNSIDIDIIPVVEYSHFDALKQMTNADWVPQTMQCKAVYEAEGFLCVLQYAFMRRDTAVNYMTSNYPVNSFETDRKRFLGDNEYGTWKNPLSLYSASLSNYEARRGDNITALLHCMGSIEPSQTIRLIVQLGQAKSFEVAKELIFRWRDPAQVTAAFENLKEFWADYLSKNKVQTPCLATNSMLNVFNPRQCQITANWSRDLSLYQLGFGGRGIGVRDSAQDMLGIIDRIADEAKRIIGMLLSVQNRDGSSMHQFYASTMEASQGDSLERDDRPHYYSDDHLWPILAVCEYVKETADIAFLQEKIPFYDKSKDGHPIETASVLEHLHRAIEFSWNNRGSHGLPLLGFADWNDTVNLAPGAESCFTANLLGKALIELIDLEKFLGNQENAKKYSHYYKEIREAFCKAAWDGEWFISYFDHDGSPLGSHINEQGKIYLNAQSWPVISGFAEPQKAIKALDSARRLLNTKHGLKLIWPGFDGFDPSKGGITTYPPGAKENGGIFLHTNPWMIIAETIVGRGDRAFEYYSQINPALKNDIIEIVECEPYVYPQNILGDEHPQFGLARNSWLSGTAAWCYTAASKYILGVRPTYHGLCIDPCIPSNWDCFKVSRKYRGAIYEIDVCNPNHVCKGIKKIKCNGVEISGNILAVASKDEKVKVEVIMG